VTVGDNPDSEWDVFVSYTQADRAWAVWIAYVLEEAGHRVLVQAWDFVPGTNWIRGMQDGVTRAARTLAVLSPDYLDSVYGGAEWRAAWAADPGGEGRRLLTVRVADCPRPGLLAGVVGIDVFGVPEPKAERRLRDMLRRADAGRDKPDRRPEFPPARRAVPAATRFPGDAPRFWYVPALRNPHVTGRTAELAALARDLADGTTVTVHSVYGLGGVGKTQLANEYAYAHAGAYDLAWWISAEEPTLIPDQFARLADRLGLEVDGDPQALRGAVHDALREVNGWLLVFDNADHLDDVRPWLPAVPLPAGVPGHVIITTRRGGYRSLGAVLELDVIGPADAVRMIRNRAPEVEEPDAAAIAEELGRLPLALEQAAAYLDSTRMPPPEYLDLLRTRAAELHALGRVDQRDDTIASLWDLSLERISAKSPAAGHLLDVCAYLAPEPIPLDLFTAHPDVLPDPLAAAARDKLAFADTVALIVDYSLAKRTRDGSLLLHRLVLAALRSRHARAATVG
jgi:hypothetical protein